LKWTATDDLMLGFYSRFLKPGDLCFDVGANIGNRSKIFLKLGAKVIALEPQKQCVRVLRSAFSHEPSFDLIEAACGSKVAKTEMLIADGTTISTLSRGWANAVCASGRFSAQRWIGKEEVDVITLDSIITKYGVPAFLKIDVERYEYEVLSGLTRPVNVFSIEYTPEWHMNSMKCIEHASSLGDVVWNFSNGESMAFINDKWMSSEQLINTLQGLHFDLTLWGDIYGRFIAS
jgi:FkbM family methyltransferase